MHLVKVPPDKSLERTQKASAALAYTTCAPALGAAQLNCWASLQDWALLTMLERSAT
jgi:hypothetical protein